MSNINFSHTSVLLFECIEALNIRDGYTYIDCTAGGGGHSFEIAKRLGDNGRLIAIDQDEDAIKAATARLSGYLDKVTFVNDNFSTLGEVLRELDIKNLGGVLADLGAIVGEGIAGGIRKTVSDGSARVVGVRLGDTALWRENSAIRDKLPEDTVICLMMPTVLGNASDSSYQNAVDYVKALLN